MKYKPQEITDWVRIEEKVDFGEEISCASFPTGACPRHLFGWILDICYRGSPPCPFIPMDPRSLTSGVTKKASFPMSIIGGPSQGRD